MQKSEKNLMLTHPSTQELGNYVLLEPTYYTSATKLSMKPVREIYRNASK